MSVVECDERIGKEIPPSVARILLQLLANFGVPVEQRNAWLYAQTELLATLREQYRKDHDNDR